MSESPWNIGDLVRDRDDDDPDPAIVVNIPNVRADEWHVPRYETTVAEDNSDYPADALVVTVLFEDTLTRSFPDWERDDVIPYDTLNEVGVQHYTFPAPRLEPAKPTAESDSESDTPAENSSDQPSAAVRALEARLEDGGMTTHLEDDERTICATKLGDTYRVRPGEVLDGNGPFRERLEAIVESK